MKTMTEKEPIRSDSPELNAMSLPKLKEVASQLGIDGAAKLKKDALVQALLIFKQPTEKQLRQSVKLVVKRATIETKKMRHATQIQITDQIQITIHKATAAIVSIAMTVAVDATEVVDVIAIVIAETVKNANQLSQKMTYYFQ